MNEEIEVSKSLEEKTNWPPMENANTSPIPQQHLNIAMPSTPQGAPAVGSNFSEFDLPFELAQQGWRKFWSKRENRPYFWNKLTGESLWEMPLIKPQFDPITDPLGICAPGPPPPTAGTLFFIEIPKIMNFLICFLHSISVRL